MRSTYTPPFLPFQDVKAPRDDDFALAKRPFQLITTLIALPSWRSRTFESFLGGEQVGHGIWGGRGGQYAASMARGSIPISSGRKDQYLHEDEFQRRRMDVSLERRLRVAVRRPQKKSDSHPATCPCRDPEMSTWHGKDFGPGIELNAPSVRIGNLDLGVLPILSWG